MEELHGRVAVVTGAASGIGFGMAERFGAEGMKVVLADVEEPALAEAEKKLNDAGVTTLLVATDVSKWEDVAALAGKAFDEFGAVHVICNNAGVGGGGRATAVGQIARRVAVGDGREPVGHNPRRARVRAADDRAR